MTTPEWTLSAQANLNCNDGRNGNDFSARSNQPDVISPASHQEAIRQQIAALRAGADRLGFSLKTANELEGFLQTSGGPESGRGD